MWTPSPKLKITRWPNNVPVKRRYALTDFHGSAFALAKLLHVLLREEQLTPEDLVVLIGDYPDRGPQSRQVVTRLIDFRRKHRLTRFLGGNHDKMVLAFLLEGRGRSWIFPNGGNTFLESYGVPPELWQGPLYQPMIDAYDEVRMFRPFVNPFDDQKFDEANCAWFESIRDNHREICSRIPKSHVQFYRRLLMALEIDTTLFVHTGLDWSKPLEEQTEDDALWSRLQGGEHNFGKFVVHGHTPGNTYQLVPHFGINIDTGCAYNSHYSERLTCLEMTSGRIIQVHRDTGEVTRAQIHPELLQPQS